jgi:hypothetical protein
MSARQRPDMIARKTCLRISPKTSFACQAYPALPAAGRGWFAGLGGPLAEYAASLRFQTSAHPTHNRRGANLRQDPERTRAQWTPDNSAEPTQEEWWSLSGSNRRPEACKATALPAELRPPWRSQGLTLSPKRRRQRPSPCRLRAKRAIDNGGPGTTRTSDLTLIRGAL